MRKDDVHKASTTEPTGATTPGGSAVLATRPCDSLIRDISLLTEDKEQPQPMPSDHFDADIIVIGAGPGGYVAAIRAAQLGAKVLVVEKSHLGGTCLNWGCIPSKVLVASVERLGLVKHASQLGVEVSGEVGINFGKVMARKDKVVSTLRGGVGALFKKHGIGHVEGFASFVDPHTVVVERDGQKQTLRGKHFLLAMGSSVIRLNIPGLVGEGKDGVWTSDDALGATEVPKRMLVVGGGAVGVELGYVYNGMGSQVTLVEMMPTLVPTMDEDIGKELAKLLTRQGIKVMTGVNLEKCEKVGGAWKCTVKAGDKVTEVEVDVVLLGVGRKANVEGMNLEGIGVKLHKKGVEVVDDTLRTHVPNIYAIGDVIGRIQLAHMASSEGILAVTNILKGEERKMDYRAVPGCVYTVPEVASVGLSEQQAIAQGLEVKVGRFAFRPLGKAMATGEQDGFVKVVCDAKYGEVLGVHMIGAHVTDMIHEGVLAIKLEATLDSIVETIHAHPTMSEAVLEAFEDAHGMAVHKL